MSDVLARGDTAPNFSIESLNGTVKKSTFKGKYLVLYFYPKDNTPGCTTEAIDFTSLSDKFEAANAEILGVSKDSLKKHENFRDKQNLGINLGSDESGEVCEAYGVWVEKKMYGKTFMGIQRSTFLIDPKGKIAEVWPKVKVKGHAAAVLEALKNEA